MSTDPTTPTIDEVASLIRARTKDVNGNELGTFTADTRPTDVQAQQAIDNQVILLHAHVGVVGDGCSDLARMAAALGAAAEIELSYFPEQVNSGRSIYPQLLDRYADAVTGVESCVLGNLPGQTPDGTAVTGTRFGTIECVSGPVSDFYTGQFWPPVALPPEPEQLP